MAKGLSCKQTLMQSSWVEGPLVRCGAKILTQGGLTSKYENIQCIINFQISMGGQIWLFIETKFDNVSKIQSFSNDLFDIGDHKIDHPIPTNKHFQ